MSKFRIAVVDDDDVVFQWRQAFDSLEDAQAQVATAQVEFPDFDVHVEGLQIERDEETGQPVSSSWVEVTE